MLTPNEEKVVRRNDLRAQFASSALSGLLAGCAGDNCGFLEARSAAEKAVKYADALLDALNVAPVKKGGKR